MTDIPVGWRVLEEEEIPQYGDRYESSGGLLFPIEIRLPKDFAETTRIIRYNKTIVKQTMKVVDI